MPSGGGDAFLPGPAGRVWPLGNELVSFGTGMDPTSALILSKTVVTSARDVV